MSLEDALAYARDLGWYVFPLVPGGKAPLDSTPQGAFAIGTNKEGPKGKDRATRNPEEIRLWWSAIPTAGIGVATAPSGIVVLDVDIADGKPGAQSLAALQSEIGALPQTLTQRSARGGTHYVYRRPDGVEPHQRLNFRPGLDLISNGYIVVAPTQLSEGGAYVWQNPTTPIAELPPSLANVIKGEPRNATSAPITIGPGMRCAPEQWQAAVTTLASAWPRSGRHSAQLALAGALAREGWEEEQIAAFCAAVAIAEPGREPGYDGEISKRFAAARDSVAKVEAGLEVAAWGALKESVDTFAVDCAKDLLCGPVITDGDRTFVAAMGAQIPAPAPATTLLSIVPASALPRTAREAFTQRKLAPRIYPTGIPSLDGRIGGGIMSRTATCIVARTGAGKSGLVLGIGRHIMRAGVPFLYASSELEHDEIVARAAALESGDSHGDIYLQRIALDPGALPELLYILDRDEVGRGQSALDRLRSATQAIAARHGTAPLVVLDYLQNVVDEDPRSVRLSVSGAAEAMRKLSQDFDAPVIAVSSTARSLYRTPKEGADDPLTYLSAAKESGDIEYAAANLIFLDVDKDHVDGVHSARIVVAKARRGSVGFVGAKFHGPSGRWDEHAAAVVELSAERRVERHAQQQVDGDVSKLVELVRQWCIEGRPKSTSAIRNSGAMQRIGKALQRALETGELETREIVRIEGGRPKNREVVVPRGHMLPNEPGAPPPLPAPVAPEPTLAPMFAALRGQS